MKPQIALEGLFNSTTAHNCKIILVTFVEQVQYWENMYRSDRIFILHSFPILVHFIIILRVSEHPDATF